jgi:hypothetical protein
MEKKDLTDIRFEIVMAMLNEDPELYKKVRLVVFYSEPPRKVG